MLGWKEIPPGVFYQITVVQKYSCFRIVNFTVCACALYDAHLIKQIRISVIQLNISIYWVAVLKLKLAGSSLYLNPSMF